MRRCHCKKSQYTVYCGRPSIYGNLWVIGEHGTRDQVCDKFEAWLNGETINHPQATDKRRAELLEAISKLSDSDILGCWCFDNQRCHCDSIIKKHAELTSK